jgi:cytochrome c oxidase assembly protein subunit 11
MSTAHDRSEDAAAQSAAMGVRNRRVAFICASVVVGMLGLAYASVPLYDLFCRVTGYGGTTATADTLPDHILDEEITVRFDANVAEGMPWIFEPVEDSMRLRIGESGLAFYRATNPTDRPVAGQAVFNVAPTAAGGFFTKVECFCFVEQVLMPGESVEMPVSFYVDPSIRDDADGRGVHAITLSYTFYQIEMPETAALAPSADSGQNTTN